jgi:S-adenosylmethionine-diacylglycerol 3-amino-3-carboxypropyl transferase
MARLRTQTAATAEALKTTRTLVSEALRGQRPEKKTGLTERIFAKAFSGLVYPMIWEDPVADMEAMGLKAGDRVLTIASGGCNWLAYLERGPARIDAVDLNAHHVALSRLKQAVYASRASDAEVARFFSCPGHSDNPFLYDRLIAPVLDSATRTYWSARDKAGRRRISVFARNFHHTGLLGRFIAFGHAIARLNGVDPAVMLQAETMEEQRKLFDTHIAPLFDTRLVRLGARMPVSLFGLGIPPAQYEALLDGRSDMADVLKERVERLACAFPIHSNPFAWMGFGRRFPHAGEGSPPAAIEMERLPAIRANVAAAHIHHANLLQVLQAATPASYERYVLLDAQDWMDDGQLDALWSEIDRTASPEATVLFRTAGKASVIEGRIAPGLLQRWTRDGAASERAFAEDRSAIYGGVHLYRRAPR